MIYYSKATSIYSGFNQLNVLFFFTNLELIVLSLFLKLHVYNQKLN